MNADTQKYNISLFNGSKDFFRQNNHLKNDSFEKIKILNELKIKANNALLLDSSAIGNKNLLYYSIFGPSFVFLLELSLKTIAKNCNVNFDLLFITDAPTLHMLETIDVLNKFNWDYHLVDTPVDGVEASIQKLQVFAYKNIDLYKNILFLDADVICTKDFTGIFKVNNTSALEVVVSPLVNRKLEAFPEVIKSAVLSHSLSTFTEENIKFIEKNNPLVFNAGHFYFVNNLQMKEHFNNILWLKNIWPAVYFFEQSFMNQYFVLNDLVSYKNLDKIVTVLTVDAYTGSGLFKKQNIELQHNEHCHALLHFAGATCNGKSKYLYINYYCNKFNICL
jgi:lipopolysaccharide biosynthesis glycosyltransferase